MMKVSLGDLAALVGGELTGDPAIEIYHALPLCSKLPEHCITLVDKPQASDVLRSSSAAAVVAPCQDSELPLPAILVQNPHVAFERIIRTLRPPREVIGWGVHPQASIDPSARIGAGASVSASAVIGPGCVIGENVRIHHGVTLMADCHVEADCELYPGVVLYPDTRLGKRCIVHAGTVLGANGFGYRLVNGQHVLSSQLGWVEIEDDVELGAGVTIDRGTYGPTRIGQGTKIDNQVMIGHNCRIGRHNLICAQVGIAGSSSTGDYVVLAGQVGIKDHIQISDKAVVGAQSGVMHNLEQGVWCGTPAVPLKKHMQTVAQVQRLSNTRSDLKALQQQVAELQKQVERLTAASSTQQLSSQSSSARAA